MLRSRKMPGLRRFEAGRVLATPDGSAPPYYFIAELSFDDAEALQAARGTSEGQAAAGDMANFATGGVTLMIAEACAPANLRWRRKVRAR